MNREEFRDLFCENVERERVLLGYTQAQMAEALEMSISNYKKLINGQTTRVDAYTFYLLYELSHKYAFEFLGMSNREMDIIRKMKTLSEQQLMYVNAFVETESVFKQQHTNEEDYITVFIPTGNMQDGMIYDTINVEKLNIAHYRAKFGPKIHYAIKITTNHFTPAYLRNDVLLISKEPISDGDTGLFLNRENGCFYIRKYVQGDICRLEPINQLGVAFEVNQQDQKEVSKWVKFGKIITKVR